MPSARRLDLDEGHLRFLQALAAASLPVGEGERSIAELRDAAAAARLPWGAGGAAMDEIVERTVGTATGSVRVRIYYPQAARPLPALVYLHGGGWTLLDIDTHDRIMREYAFASGWAVVAVDFPRSPEAPFPGAIRACAEVLPALSALAADLGLSQHPLALAGDSSGANLALATALMLRDEGVALLDALILGYGVYDCDLTRPSYAAFSHPPFTLSAERMAWFWENYCAAPEERENPLASPLRADLSGLPPIRLISAGQDVLRDENVALSNRLIEAGNALSLDHYPRAPHGFLEALAIADVGQRAIRRAADWLNDIAVGDRAWAASVP
jgi:acetyl esterase